MLRIALACLIPSLMTGCASIVSGQNQSVTVTTRANGAEVPGAKCTLSNDKGKWYTATPGSVVVRRSYGELAVNCTHDSLEAGTQSFKSTTKAMAFGNVIFGGVVGAAVDVSTGAAYDYPDLLQITLGPLSAAAQPGAAGAAVATAPVAPPPPPAALVGTRFVVRELDVISGVPGGESNLTLTAISPTEAVFNDGAVKLGLAGQDAPGSSGGGALVGIRIAELSAGGRSNAKFAPGAGAETVPIELNVTSVETLPDVLGGLRVARVQVSGYSQQTGSGGVSRAPINGEAMVDLTTGLVLSAKVISRQSTYSMRRELIRVIRAERVTKPA